MTTSRCAVDECPYWYIDSIDGATTATPGPTPTAGPTKTPLTIEHEDWQTRCRKLGLHCNDPSATPSEPFCAMPEFTPVPPGPDPTDNHCMVTTPWPPAMTAQVTPVRTKPPTLGTPTPGPRVGMSFPTDSAATCAPTPTPTLTPSITPTFTPSITPTPTSTFTPTLTPTITPTPLPLCETATPDRVCPVGYSGCLNGCLWNLPSLTMQELQCDEDEDVAYTLTVTATECDGNFNIDVVKVQWAYDSTHLSGYVPMMEVPSTNPQQWTLTTCTTIKPRHYSFKWITVGSLTTRGLDSATIEVCCSAPCPTPTP